jgi:sugar lactone lactonase YvrE
MKNLPGIFAALMLPVVFCPIISYAFTGDVVRKFPTPGQYSTGIACDGKNLWVADRKTDLIYVVNPADGNIIRSIPSPGYWPTGLAWDGTSLWCADIKGGQDVEELYEGVIYRLDPKDGTVLQTMAAPSKYPVDLAWDGTYLWCVDNSSDEIIQFSPKDGTTIRSFKAPTRECQGLEYDGLYLWVASSAQDEIYMVLPENGTVIMVLEAPGPVAAGLCYDGEFLWNADYQDDLLYQLKVRDDEKFIRKNERQGKVIFTHQVKNFGPGKVLSADVHLAIPANRDNQDILDISYNIKPKNMVTDRWGQVTAHYQETDIMPGETRTVEMTTLATTYDVDYFIFPDKVGSLDQVPADIRAKYLEDNEKFQIHNSIIQGALSSAVGDEKNPYWIARKIFNYIIANMYYEMTGGWNTAPTVLARGNGSCSEYAFVFISMCRAAGVPARYVGSVVVRGEDASMDDVFHRWAEIYLPGYGWVPVDPSRGDSDWPRNQAMAIGHLTRGLLITTQSGGGSETMEWTYNSNRFYITEPKTLVNFEHFADWEVVK